MNDAFESGAALQGTADRALLAAEVVLDRMRDVLSGRLRETGPGRSKLPDSEQHFAHVFAWHATIVEGLRETRSWLVRLEKDGLLGSVECDLATIAFGEQLSQLVGGVPMSQGEFARLSAFGLFEEAMALAADSAVSSLISTSESGRCHQRIAEAMADAGTEGLFDRDGLGQDLALIRDQFRRFTRERVAPDAHRWHLEDRLVPDSVLAEMAALGVFGVTIPEDLAVRGWASLKCA